MSKQHILLAAALSILLSGAGPPAAAQPAEPVSSSTLASAAGTLRITGSSTLAPLIADLAQRFQGRWPGVAITVEAGGSNRGIADVRAGKADIGMASRALKPEEQDDLFAISIARDAVAFVTHRDNRVRAITRAQAAAIYQGRVTRWTALGGEDAPIKAVSRPPTHSSLEIVADYLGLRPEQIKAQVVAGDNADVLLAVLDDPHTLAFVSLGAAVDLAGQGIPIAPLIIDGVPATITALRTGRYPLARTLNLLTRQVPNGIARAFIEFVRAPGQRGFIEDKDFVPYE
jgi:phosphate transport system substrate-binding protein